MAEARVKALKDIVKTLQASLAGHPPTDDHIHTLEGRFEAGLSSSGQGHDQVLRSNRRLDTSKTVLEVSIAASVRIPLYGCIHVWLLIRIRWLFGSFYQESINPRFGD